jgi:hypothetical protein
MTIEEISLAKADAEKRIQHELQQLKERTGMDVAEVSARVIDITGVDSLQRRAVADVSIDLRVP